MIMLTEFEMAEKMRKAATVEIIKDEMKKCGFQIADPGKPLKYKSYMKLDNEKVEMEMYNFIVPFGSDLDCSEKIMKMIDKLFEIDGDNK